MLRFGVAGFPPAFAQSSYKKDRLRVFDWLAELGLDAFEIQMTYGPRSSRELCKQYADAARSFGIRLSVHASYFIVLTSSDQQKIRNSIDTLARTFELAAILDAKEIVLHPGPIYAQDAGKSLATLINNLTKFFDGFGTGPIGLFLETAGKLGQLGSIEEILQVTKAVAGTYPCIDFGHVHARTRGTLSEPANIRRIFEVLVANDALTPNNRIHFHYTPIHYGPRGELVHKSIVDRYETPPQGEFFSKPNEGLYHPRLEPIIDGLRSYDIDCTVISETHDSQEQGALAMKNWYVRRR
jgi:deoxyribonuclease-4